MVETVRLVGFGGALSLVAALSAGCGGSEQPVVGEALGSAEQAVTCLTVQRSGPAPGGVEDAQVVMDVADPTKAFLNYGSVAQMNTGFVGTDWRRVLMKFDLSTIPVGSTVLSSTLTLRMIQSPGKGALDVFLLAGPWTEKTITYAQLGQGFFPAVRATIPTLGVPNNSALDVDMTAMVSDWISGGVMNNGILIDHYAAGRTAIGSSEAPTIGPRPKLTVCYAPATCSDGIQNQDETGVDCGGSICGPCTAGG
jgi:hypothetical protein